MADATHPLADLTEIKRWAFETPPKLDINLRSFAGLVFPRRRHSYKAIIDTGFDYEILMSNDIYEVLKLRKWEYPDQRTFILMDGSPFPCWESLTEVTITGTDLCIPEVPVVTPVDDNGTTYLNLGADFIKRLRLLLLGNLDHPEIVLLGNQ